ncbi:MAG: hypothetical protein KatS3mg027_1065 [Bacteroidia bacterium]|nr:MAG: hypothetical protein KatS3mg027_1065 [Bacteroidia bacterium]
MTLIKLIIVSNEQLIATIIASFIIIISSIIGIILNIYFLLKTTHQRNKFVRFFLIALFSIAAVFFYNQFTVNYSFYRNNTFVVGKVLDFCKTDRNEEGVYFEYHFNNQLFRNCNVIFPFPKDSVKIGKTYQVRVNKLHPEDGRIILN